VDAALWIYTVTIENNVEDAAPEILEAAGVDANGLRFSGSYRDLEVSGTLPEGFSAGQIEQLLEDGRGPDDQDTDDKVSALAAVVATFGDLTRANATLTDTDITVDAGAGENPSGARPPRPSTPRRPPASPPPARSRRPSTPWPRRSNSSRGSDSAKRPPSLTTTPRTAGARTAESNSRPRTPSDDRSPQPQFTLHKEAHHMIWVLVAIRLPLPLALLLGVLIGWLLWRWRRRQVSQTEWNRMVLSGRSAEDDLAQLQTTHQQVLGERDSSAGPGTG